MVCQVPVSMLACPGLVRVFPSFLNSVSMVPLGFKRLHIYGINACVESPKVSEYLAPSTTTRIALKGVRLFG